MNTCLRRLLDLVPVPDAKDATSGTTSNLKLGPSIQLPADYIEFLNLYGRGWFSEVEQAPCLQVFDLVSDCDTDQVQLYLGCLHEGAEELPELVPKPFPARPGLLPWGSDINGTAYYWKVDSGQTQWPIVESFGPCFTEHAMTFCEFLLGCFQCESGDAHPYLFSDSAHVGYCPSSRYRDCFNGTFRVRTMSGK